MAHVVVGACVIACAVVLVPKLAQGSEPPVLGAVAGDIRGSPSMGLALSDQRIRIAVSVAAPESPSRRFTDLRAYQVALEIEISPTIVLAATATAITNSAETAQRRLRAFNALAVFRF